MKRLLSLCAVAGLVLLASGVFTLASAQQMVPRAQASGGWQMLAFKGDVDQTFMTGWYADLLANFNPYVGGVFEIGGGYKTVQEFATVQGTTSQVPVDLNVHDYLGGVRVSARPTTGVTPYGQFLAGAVRRTANWPASVTNSSAGFFQSENGSSATDLAIQIGAGVNWFFSRQVGVRIGADYMRVYPQTEAIAVIRTAAGLVIGF